MMRVLREARIQPGLELTVEQDGTGVRVTVAGGHSTRIDPAVAAHVFVSAA
jgi:hypothetical protein